MLILTIRTDKPEAEIGLFDDDKKLAYETWLAHRQLAETIHSKIKLVLGGQKLGWQDIEGLVYYQGPGSFTGLRIGASVANALAFGLAIPIVTASGEDWQILGLEELLAGGNQNIITPDYGAPAHTTRPKK
jgi:tRNA threonylcarbamoyladenosine biosynthesis protein TsaB